MATILSESYTNENLCLTVIGYQYKLFPDDFESKISRLSRNRKITILSFLLFWVSIIGFRAILFPSNDSIKLLVFFGTLITILLLALPNIKRSLIDNSDKLIPSTQKFKDILYPLYKPIEIPFVKPKLISYSSKLRVEGDKIKDLMKKYEIEITTANVLRIEFFLILKERFKNYKSKKINALFQKRVCRRNVLCDNILLKYGLIGKSIENNCAFVNNKMYKFLLIEDTKNKNIAINDFTKIKKLFLFMNENEAAELVEFFLKENSLKYFTLDYCGIRIHVERIQNENTKKTTQSVYKIVFKNNKSKKLTITSSIDEDGLKSVTSIPKERRIEAVEIESLISKYYGST